MSAIKKIVFFTFLALCLGSCSQEQYLSTTSNSVDDQVLIYQELMRMEYALLTSDYKKLLVHSQDLDQVLRDNYNLFCPEESAQIDGARMSNKILAQNVKSKSKHHLLDDLRILKGTIVHLVSDEDYDPFFAFLWSFEEDMYFTTSIAMDPKLDLYEWNEFQVAVACMNESWKPLQIHRPSAEMLDNDPKKYKNQSVYKIYLEKALEEFNLAVSSADYIQYPLCDAAENVQRAYIDYIKTFIEQEVVDDTFMAQL